MSNTRKTSTAELTEEQRSFLSKVLARATSPWGDADAPRDSNSQLIPIGQPYLAHILYSLIPINAPDCPTMGVDKYGRLYINFDAFMNPESPISGLASATKAMNHEPYHLMYKHAERFEKLPAKDPDTGHRKNHKAWNHAGDLTINQGIRPLVPDWALHVGEEGPYKDFPLNLTSEDYYKMIKDMADVCPDCWQPNDKNDENQEEDKSDKGDSGSDSQDGSNDSDESADSGNGEASSDKGDSGSGGDSEDGSESGGSGSEPSSSGAGEGQSDGSGGSSTDSSGSNGGSPSGHTGKCPGCGKDAPVDCGSGAGGEGADWELDADEAPILDEYKIDDLRRATAEEIKRQSKSRNPGNIPGNLLVWANDVLKAPLPDWKSILRATFLKGVSWKRGKMDYSYSRPNRRNQNPKFMFPALRAPKVRIAVGIDTSGSNLHNLGLVVKNIEDLSRQSGCRGQDLLAFGVDMTADKTRPVNSPTQVLEDVRGGGGTDMRVAFQVFEKLGRENKADIGILLTDLETGWPSKPPKADMKYIVVGILRANERDSIDVQKAQKALKGWADLVVITPEQFAE